MAGGGSCGELLYIGEEDGTWLRWLMEIVIIEKDGEGRLSLIGVW